MHTKTHLQTMAAVNWICLVLAFVLIKIHVCIKVDPNEIPNGNYTTSSLKSYTLQPYGISTIISNETNNFTVLGGDTELSALERTRRLIPYMAFYVPVSELPINKQYVNRNNIHSTKQLVRPSATGGGIGPTGSHIPIPTQYVHGSVQYLPPAPSAPSSADGQQHYHPNAGLSIYHTHGYEGHQEQLQPKQQQQQKYHLVPPSQEHLQHLQPPGPPGPSALALPSFDGHSKGNGKGNNAFVTYQELNPIRQKTVQHFPPLSSTASSAFTSSASAPAYETIRQTSSFTRQQQKVRHQHGVGGSSGNNNNAADAVYRSRTKQSKINLTPFTPSNTVPGDFVPIVYRPINNNNNNNNHYNNHIFNSHKAGEDDLNDFSSFNQDEQQQKQYRKQQHQQQPQQIGIEYSSSSSDLLPPPSGSSAPIPLDVSQRHHHNQQQLHKSQQQSQYFGVTQSGVNVDLTHDVNGGAAVGTITSVNSVNSALHQQHNDAAIRSPKPQYNEYLIDEPKQSLDDEQQQQQQNQLELLKPTVGPPPTHALILVTTAAPLQQETITQENYGSSLRSSYNSKPKIRLQPVIKEKNVVNYAAIREQNPTERPRIITITPTPESHQYNVLDEKPKYVYLKEEFGQKLSTVAEDGAVKLKPLNKYKSDDSQIPQQQQHHQQQHIDELSLQPLEPKLTTTQHQHEYHHYHNNNNEVQANVPFTPTKTILADPNELPDIRTSSLAEILHKLQESNHLPHTLTPDNIDNSIKTLIRILNNLKQTQTIVANPPQHHEISAHVHPSSPDYDYTTTGSEKHQQQPQPPHDLSLLTPTGPNKHPGPSTGRPGIDYPNYANIPQTSFECSQQRYKGFFGDPETNCQVWHYCDLNGGKASFLCPNGTIFSQIVLTCDWWFNVKCATTPQLYVLNERLYKYILPFTPKFPEDYSGPLVDKYLAMKFQEMEEKMRMDREKSLQEEAEDDATTTETEQQTIETVSENSKEDNHLEETTSTAENDDNRPHAKQQKHESVNSQVSEQSSERNLLIDDEVNDISQRGTVDNFESTTIATGLATKKSELMSFSLKPIIVSSTLSPDYADEDDESHENEKRSNKNTKVVKETNKPKIEKTKTNDDNDKSIGVSTEKTILPTSSTLSPNKMQITVEKLNVIEIKSDRATDHLIRDMLSHSKNTD